MNQWSPDDIGELAGRVAIVTGSNRGIGLHAAVELACHGARVVVATRDAARGRAAVETIRTRAPRSTVDWAELDLADLSSVRAFADRFLDRHDRLDLLLNNAGIGYVPYGRSKDGFETTFATNHLGHFALTGLLLSRLLASPDARVVTVASRVHGLPHAELDLADPQFENGYRRSAAYARSKLANLLFAFELHRRLTGAARSLRSVATSPRLTATSFGPPELALRVLLRMRLGWGAQPVAIGSLPILYAATAPEVAGGDYIQPLTRGGAPTKQRAAPWAYDESSARRLWELSEDLTGCAFEI